MADDGPLILTIGHSTRPLGEFLDLLEQHGCGTVVDVRSLPRSRRYPQYNREGLAAALEERGISYRHCAPLGGLRPLDPSRSGNSGLRNERFRAYADHMQTGEFADAVARLVDLASANRRCAVMCAEAVPWRCHRSLLADALAARGCRVLHVIDRNRVEEHRFRKEAVVVGKKVSYPSDPGQQRLDL